jgi:hypothetical protein
MPSRLVLEVAQEGLNAVRNGAIPPSQVLVDSEYAARCFHTEESSVELHLEAISLWEQM